MVLWRDDHREICWYFYIFDYYEKLLFDLAKQKGSLLVLNQRFTSMSMHLSSEHRLI